MTPPIQVDDVVSLRTRRASDATALVEEAANRAVWRNVTYVFPHPYTGDDAQRAIYKDGEFVDEWFYSLLRPGRA